MRGWRLSVGLLVLVAGFAAGALAAARASRAVASTGDMAVTESYTLLAEHGELLVGPYSRFQWHHPGPVFFYTLVPFYAASGHRAAGLNAAAAVLNLAMLVAAVAIAARAAGALFGALVCASLTAFLLRVPDFFVSAWNPHVVVLPLAVCALASAAAAAGDAWMLPVAAAAASFAAQTHVGTLPVSLFLCGAGVLAFLAAASRGGASPPWRSLAVTLMVAILLWTPSIVEQFSHGPGNITMLWRFFASGAGSGQPFRAAFLQWANMLSGIARPGFYLAHGWALRPGRGSAVQTFALAQMALLAAIAAASLTRGRRFECRLALFLLGASLIGLWSTSRIDGDVIDHEIFWVSVFGALNVAAILYGIASIFLARDVITRARVVFGTGTGTLIVVCAAVAALRMLDIRTRSLSPGPDSVGIVRAADGIREYLTAHSVTRPLVDIDQASWNLAAGVLLQMQKQGMSYAVADDWLPMFTESARATSGERLTLSIVGEERYVRLRGQPGVVPVVEARPVFVVAYGAPAEK